MARSQVAQLVVCAFDVSEFHISNHSADASIAGIENFRPAGDFLDVVGSDRRRLDHWIVRRTIAGRLHQVIEFAASQGTGSFGLGDLTVTIEIESLEKFGSRQFIGRDFAVLVFIELIKLFFNGLLSPHALGDASQKQKTQYNRDAHSQSSYPISHVPMTHFLMAEGLVLVCRFYAIIPNWTFP